MSKVYSNEDLTNTIERHDNWSITEPDIRKMMDAITYLSAIVNELEGRITYLEEENAKLNKEIQNHKKDVFGHGGVLF